MAYYRIRQVCVAAIQFPWLDRQHRITAETWKVIICTSLSVYIVSTSLCLILFNQSHAIFWEFIGIQNPLLPKFSERSSKNLRFSKEKKFHTFHASIGPRFALPTPTSPQDSVQVSREQKEFSWDMIDVAMSPGESTFWYKRIWMEKIGLTPPIQEHVTCQHVIFNDKEVSQKKICIHACIHTYTNIHTHTHTRIRTYTCPCPSVYSSLMQFGNVKTYQAGLQNVKSTSQPVRT